MDFTAIDSNINHSSIKSIITSDFDGDNVIDLLVDTWNNSPKKYDNTGDGSFTENTDPLLTGISVISIAAEDFDGDRDVDLYVFGYNANREQISQIYNNDGNGNFIASSNISLPNADYRYVTTGDFDGDRDVDLYLTGASFDGFDGESATFVEEYNGIYSNDGNGNFTEILSEGLPPFVHNDSHPKGDFDGDGDLDLVIAGSNLGSYYVSDIYNNDGSGRFSINNNTGLPTFSNVIAEDFDGDNDLDLFLTPLEVNNRNIAQNPALYENNGSGEFALNSDNSFAEVSSGNTIAEDFDLDGDIDLLSPKYDSDNYTHSLQIYSNDGSGKFTASTSLPTNVRSLFPILSEDFDGDSDSDILVTGRDSNNNPVSQIYRNNTIFDNTEDNNIKGTDSPETIDAGTGNDTIYGSLGADSLNGGDGIDSVSYINSPAAVTVDLLAETGLGNSSHADGDRLDSIEQLEGSNFDDILIGKESADRLDGGEGSDTLIGLTGNDNLSGHDGNDLINGGEGSDRLIETADVNFTLTDTQLTGLGTDNLNSVELARLQSGADDNIIDTSQANNLNVTLVGGAGNDSLYGGAKADVLYGESGNDTLLAGSGNDSLYGGYNNDVLHGEGGNDLINGGAGSDLLRETAYIDLTLTNTELKGRGIDTIRNIEFARLQGNTKNNTINANKVNDLNVTLVGAEGNDSLYGGAKADVLHGQNGNDRLIGAGGNDTLYGGNNNDTLKGGVGNDILNGGAGYDKLIESGDVDFTLSNIQINGLGMDAISQIESAYLAGGTSNNLLDASSATTIETALVGNAGNDTLIGSQMTDSIYGGTGEDILDGKMGDDILIGGAKADVFVLESAMGADTVKDFQNGVDRFGLSNSLEFTDLNITNNASGTATLIADITNGNSLLAVVNKVEATNITAADFVAI